LPTKLLGSHCETRRTVLRLIGNFHGPGVKDRHQLTARNERIPCDIKSAQAVTVCGFINSPVLLLQVAQYMSCSIRPSPTAYQISVKFWCWSDTTEYEENLICNALVH
jgi:hypothetical protein